MAFVRGSSDCVEGCLLSGRRNATSMWEEACDRHDIVDFSRHGLRHIEGKVIIIWQGKSAKNCRIAWYMTKKLRAFIVVPGISAFPDQRPRSKPFQRDGCPATLDCFAFERKIPPPTSLSSELQFIQIGVSPAYRADYICPTDRRGRKQSPAMD